MNAQLPLTAQIPSPSSPPFSNTKPSITDFTITIPGSKVDSIKNSSNNDSDSYDETSLPRWSTPEFRFYTLIFILVVPLMVWIPIRLSSPSHPNYWKFEHRLSEGWFGYKVDNSDAQYRTFRSNLIPLLGLSSIYLITSYIFSKIVSPSTPQQRIKFIAYFSGLMIILLHGISSIKIISILSLNYHISKLPIIKSAGIVKKFWPALIIIGNMGILFMNEKNDGYKFGELHAALGTLDSWSGLLPRWHISFNITMMRMVSFSLDYLWREQDQNSSQEVPTEYRQRVKISLPEEDYGFTNYLAYCLYPPLYIAGPIMTFNDFLWQIRNPTTISTKSKVSYGIRFMFSYLSMESVLHTMYVVAIKDTKAWEGDSPAEMSMIGFWNLVVVWLKLLIPWRFFRLWALLDGMDPPENMIRCVANNYSTLGFWRSWHRSYNLWVVRYIYIPVGGSRNVILATGLVFTFVALWHDLSFKLLAWGWLISLFILPELIARKTFSAKKYGQNWWYRHLCAIGGVINVLLMMSANLVGFVLGLDGMKVLLIELTFTYSGWLFMIFASCCLFIAVQVMFEYREEEKRKGIDRRC
ncbi:uncharacterized protein L201_005986 [Kwoniella dendrophila CBS 6074]|uniref:Glycerol transporter n=1 Tax=Kwoniella dendrophila CBS 6074 TaxID=1295534 RepID=A0AAX4JZY9_9TREE